MHDAALRKEILKWKRMGPKQVQASATAFGFVESPADLEQGPAPLTGESCGESELQEDPGLGSSRITIVYLHCKMSPNG